MQGNRVAVFISHAPEDAALFAELQCHLAPFRNSMDVWYRGRIIAGSNIQEEVARALQQSSLVACLISSDYFANAMCCAEAEWAIQRESQGVAVVGIIVRDCYWRAAMCVPAVVFPESCIPITLWADRDEAWTNVVKSLVSSSALADFSKKWLEELAKKLPDGLGQVDVIDTRNGAHATPDASEQASFISSVNELVAVLEDRAASVRRALQSECDNVSVQKYLEEFEILHRGHIDSLQHGQFSRAHELARQIHRLSWRRESENFWQKPNETNRGVHYRLMDDAFLRGPIARRYLPEFSVRQKPHSSQTQPTSVESYVQALWRLRAS